MVFGIASRAAGCLLVAALSPGAAVPLEPAAAAELDDECAVAGDEACAVSALQRKSSKVDAAHEHFAMTDEEAEESSRALEAEGNNHTGVWHYALPCYNQCKGKGGFCASYCGPNNACCKFSNRQDPAECHGVRLWPAQTYYTCVDPGMTQDANSIAGASTGTPGELIYANVPSLLQPSNAPVFTFYMYRVQSAQTYDPENQNMANLAGALWYLHNEIVWHTGLQRSGTYFADPKTRIERFKVSTKATQPLVDLGMNFGPVDAFDLTRCTGPYQCENFKTFGYTVGCEDWNGGAASFPHQQWVGKNMYPGAKWYSLPGPCPSAGIGSKTAACVRQEPGGACRGTDTMPTGSGDCTYVYEKMGEIAIDDLEGLSSPGIFKAMGNTEYDQSTDKGKGMSFWDDKMSQEEW